MNERLGTAGDELIAAIYQAAADIIPSSRPLELLAERTRSDKAFSAHFNLEQRRGSIISSFNVEPNFFVTYKEIAAQDNPWLARSSYFQAEGLVWRGSDIVDRAKLMETQFFRLFMHTQYMHHTAHLVVRVRGADIFHVMLTRPPEAEDFDDAALDACRLFALHARHALEISGATSLWRFVEDGFVAAIDEQSAGVAVIELPGTIRYMNRTCDFLLNGRRDTAGPGTGATMWNARAPHIRRLPRSLLDALATRPVPKSFVIHPAVDEGKRPIFVQLQPYTSQSNTNGETHSGYVVFCRSADTEIEVDEAALRAAFHLTSAEARIAAALVAGENIVAVSTRLGISPQTARTHVKHIFEKTYTARQPELMKLLMSVSRRKWPATPAASAEANPLMSIGSMLTRRSGSAGAHD